MKLDRSSMLLYAITDRSWLGEMTLPEQVELCIKGGATILQLREKSLGFDEFVREAREIKSIADRYKIPFVINDNIEVALAVGADGIHVGQNDMGAKEARRLIGSGKILGVSVQTLEQAKLAEESGADYLGVGAVFSTSTKPDACLVSLDELKKICKFVSIPVVAIGGINENNILRLKGSGIAGVAVISAIFSKPDIEGAARNLLRLARQTVFK